MSNLKKVLINGAAWSLFGRMASLVVVLFTNIWLARLLSPDEFGQVGVIMFFVGIANVLTEGGLGGALVRKKEATINDYSTVFVTNLIFSLICYVLIFVASNRIAAYYDDPLIKKLLLVASLVLIINSFQITQNAKLMSDLKFKKYSIYTFISVIVASVIGVILAYQGLGVWALVVIQLLTAGMYTILLWIFEGFYLRLYFSKKSFKELYGFGINTTLASILNTAFENVYQLILARYFSFQQTGFFYQAKKLQDVPGGIITTLTQGVLFSSLAKFQDNKKSFSSIFNEINVYFMVLLAFISTFIYVYAKPVVLLLFGEKWMGSVFYLQLLTIASFFYLLEKLNRIIFKVFNQTKKILYLEYLKKSIQAVTILIGIYYVNLTLLIIGFVFTSTISYFFNYYYSHKIIDAVKTSQLVKLFKIIGISVTTALLCLNGVSFFNIKGLDYFWSLPLFFICYFLLIQSLEVLNLGKELNKLYSIYRKS